MAEIKNFPGVKLEDSEEYTPEKAWEEMKKMNPKEILMVASLEDGKIVVMGTTSLSMGVLFCEVGKQTLIDNI